MKTVHDHAKAAGCPANQMINFMRGGYVPQPKQLQFHAACRLADRTDGPRHIGYGGARGPGKSHAVFAQVTLDDCQRRPDLKVLMLRKVGKALKESADDLRRRILKHTAHTYNKGSGEITFPNGSRIKLGNFKDDSSFEALIGLEYDVVAIEECTTLTAEKYKMVNTCCRTSKPDWRPRIYSNANPGGVGHQFYHRQFIQGSEGADSTFIPATYRDNKFLDTDYVKALESLTGWKRRAWLLGDWNIHAGMYFTNFHKPTHIIKPFNVQAKGFQFYLAVDYGFQHPTAAVLLATQGNSCYAIDEYSAAKCLTKQHSKALKVMLGRHGLEQRRIYTFVLGADAWQKGRDGTSVASEYIRLGWNPEQAVMARVQGAQEILNRLGDVDAGIESHLWFFETCPGLAEQLQAMQHDPKRPEDVLKVDVDSEGYGGDDLYDALRYGLQAVATSLGPVRYGTLRMRR